jgi:hypothetical protein
VSILLTDLVHLCTCHVKSESFINPTKKNMQNIIIDQEDPRLDLIFNLMQLAEGHGNLNLIYAITHLFTMEVEENRCCVHCQRKAVWMHERLVQLLEDYEETFPPTEALQKVNHPGSGFVQ